MVKNLMWVKPSYRKTLTFRLAVLGKRRVVNEVSATLDAIELPVTGQVGVDRLMLQLGALLRL